MFICESQFEDHVPDRDDPEICLEEIDVYAWIPRTPEIANHRLSLRKRIASGKFEVYRKFLETTGVITTNIVGIFHKDTEIEQVIFQGSLEGAIEVMNQESMKHHGYASDSLCRHEYPNKAIGCLVYQRSLNQN